MKTTLVIMAAGLGSRFSGGIKQLEGMGPNGEIIMDYSIHDAIEAGFNKIVFIIRKDLENDFMEVIGNRIEKVCAPLNVEVAYAFQEKENIPAGFTVPAGRTKPWGTGQAILACKDIVKEPFAIINADDYYGKEAFVQLHAFLKEYDGTRPYDFCMAGFFMKNTLSDFGGVTRGICQVDKNNYLSGIVETKNIVKTETGAVSGDNVLDVNSYVSMNMWGVTPEFMNMLEEGFVEFFKKNEGNLDSCEYLLPIFIGDILPEGKISVKVLETNDKWFGVTYKEDKPIVVESIQNLIDAGVYSSDLFSDLG